MRLRSIFNLSCVFLFSASVLLAQDVVKVSPSTNKVLVENQNVRVVQATFSPGAKEGMHTHPASWYYVTMPGTLKVTYAGGKVEMWNAKTGESAWIDGEAPHTAENVGKTTLQYVLVEVKPAATSNSLAGTWQLVSRVDHDPSGKVVPEPGLGANPTGYLIYDSTGHVSAQLMKTGRTLNGPPVSQTAQGNNPSYVGGYDAYFGRYEVDWSTGTVTHILDGAVAPTDVGRRISRRFKLEGDTLTIEFEPGGAAPVTTTLVWKRVSR